MMLTVDARGLACPRPVIETRKAMREADQVVTLVDNDTALTNVSRMAEKAGWQVAVAQEGGDYCITITRATARPQTEPLSLGRGESVEGPLVLVVSSDTMGRGDVELGNILIRAFFHTLNEVQPLPQTVVLFNAGVKLACQESPVLADLCALESQGIELLACGTCLGYYELKDKLAVGQVSNMYTIAESLLRAGKIVYL